MACRSTDYEVKWEISDLYSIETKKKIHITGKSILLNVLLNQVENVAQRLRTNDLEARTITLKLRYDDFRTVTRSNTFDHPTNTTKTLWQEAEAIFLKWHKESAGVLRLLGFGASGLQEAGSGQHQLFPEPDQDKQKRVDEAFDKIRNKFGHDALRRGIVEDFR